MKLVLCKNTLTKKHYFSFSYIFFMLVKFELDAKKYDIYKVVYRIALANLFKFIFIRVYLSMLTIN